MNDPITETLVKCLKSIEQGEMTIEEYLELYPPYPEALEHQSGMAATPEATPNPEFRRAARTRLLNLLPNQPIPIQPTIRHPRRIGQFFLKRRYAMTWVLIITLLASLLGGGGAAYASEATLPGDTLYPVKTVIGNLKEIIIMRTY